MGERAGVDLDEQIDLLLRKYDGEPAAHLAVALARASQGRMENADVHVARARALNASGHPWSALVPEMSLWPPRPKTGSFHEEVPGRVYRVIGAKDVPGIPFANPGAATFLRMRSGELVCINPVPMTDELAARVSDHGEVTHIVAPAKYHSEGIPHAQRLFPRARTWGAPAQKGYPGVAHVRFDGYLDDSAPLFPGELDQITMRGIDVGDVWFVDRASRTLIVTDAVFATEAVPGAEPFASPFAAFYTWAWGVHGRLGVPSYQPAMWQDVRAYQESLRRALACDFEHVGSSHGPFRCTSNDGKEELRRALGFILDLSRFEALGLLFDFVRRHPGIFFRLVREQIAARKGRRATTPA
jgi:hypothetical protein